MFLVPMPQDIKEILSLYFNGYQHNTDSIKAPADVWADISMQILDDNITMNGCGSESTKFVPDTFFGLSVTPVCNVHDVMYKLAKTPGECDFANIVFLENLVAYVNDNSHWSVAWLRRYRAMTYYNAVHAGRKQFCKGYSNDS